jgi:hypothetical protein
MGVRYVVEQRNVTPTAGNDVLTIVSPSSRRIRLVQVSIAGRGSTSAAQGLEAARSTGGTTGGGAVTPNKFDSIDSPAASSTVNTTWAAQPTLETNAIPLGFNALGGAIVYNVPPGALEARNGENISIRAPASYTFQALSVSAVFEEV